MPLIKAHITVDGRGYQGEDLDVVHPSAGSLGNTWHNYNSGGVQGLKFGDPPMEIVGNISLASHVGRILDRVKRGLLDAKRIEIEIGEKS